MASPHFSNDLANNDEMEHGLFNAAVYDLEQWVAALPHLSGADITMLWPHLRRKIVGLELYSPAGTRNQQIRILLRLTRLLKGRLGVFPMCKRILRKVIEERVEVLGDVEKRLRTQTEHALPTYYLDHFGVPCIPDFLGLEEDDAVLQDISRKSRYPLLGLRSEIDSMASYVSGAGISSLVEVNDLYTFYDDQEEIIACFVNKAVESVHYYKEDARVDIHLTNGVMWQVEFENVRQASSVARSLIV